MELPWFVFGPEDGKKGRWKEESSGMTKLKRRVVPSHILPLFPSFRLPAQKQTLQSSILFNCASPTFVV